MRDLGSVRQLLFRNTLAQLTAHAVGLGIGFLTTLILSRQLGVAGFGQLNYIFAFCSFFLTFNDFGIQTAVVREISQRKEDTARILGGILLFKFLLGLFLLLTAWISLTFLKLPPSLTRSARIYMLVLPIMALETVTIVYQTSLRLHRWAWWGILYRLMSLALIFTAARLGFQLKGTVLALVLAEALFLALLWQDTRAFISFRWKVDTRLWIRVLRASLVLGTMGFFVTVVNRSGFILLERLAGLSQVGLYSAAFKVTSLLEGLPLMVMGTLFPLFSRYAREDANRLRVLYRKSSVGLCLLAVPIGVCVTLFSGFIVRRLFGLPFVQAAPTLATLVWATVFLYPAICSGNLLISLGKEWNNLIIMLAASLLSVSLNLAWIGPLGSLGAARAQVITCLFVLVANTFSVEWAFRRLRFRPPVPTPPPWQTSPPAALN